MRMAMVERKTRETKIKARLNLDGQGKAQIATGIGFFDHMLVALSVHSGLDLVLEAEGDLEVDGHHTVEDCGIVLGQALQQALGDKKGVARFGTFYIPMDDALAMVSLDLSGRPYLHFSADFHNERIGSFETCLAKEFFQALSVHGGITLHINLLYGENDHHGCEAIFKAFAHALKAAVKTNDTKEVLSTKGSLG